MRNASTVSILVVSCFSKLSTNAPNIISVALISSMNNMSMGLFFVVGNIPQSAEHEKHAHGVFFYVLRLLFDCCLPNAKNTPMGGSLCLAHHFYPLFLNMKYGSSVMPPVEQ